jgi:hypothetical protein
MNRTAEVAHRAVPERPATGADAGELSEQGGRMKRLRTDALRRSMLVVASLAAAATLVVGIAASPAGAYGGGAAHDTWQIGISGNCNNPSYCGDELGGFWGWIEFDRFANGTITGDAQTTGCGHFLRGGGGGAFHADIDITSAHIGASQPDDPNFPTGQVFYVDSNVVNGVVNDPDFLGDTGIPVEAGHYSFHPAPGVAFMIQVAFRPAK